MRDAERADRAFRRLPEPLQSEVDRLIQSGERDAAVAALRKAASLNQKTAQSVAAARARMLGYG